MEENGDAAYNFIPCDRDQTFLMPPSLHDWLGEDHLAWFVLDAVSQMDLSAFYAKYRSDGWGAAAFTPDMMVSLLLYAYCMGERSSRRIESLCETDVAFRIVAANKKPDHPKAGRCAAPPSPASAGRTLKSLKSSSRRYSGFAPRRGLSRLALSPTCRRPKRTDRSY